MMHDLAIIGGGVVGLFAGAAALARDLDVVCLEATEPLGEQSRGEGRIFRVAHERPGLCELALRSAERWAECERAAGARLVDRCGLAVVGDDAEARYAAMRAAGAECALADAGRLGGRLPQARLDDALPVLWDPAGASIRTGALGRWLRRLLGSRLRTASPVLGAGRRGPGWSLTTPGGAISARAVAVCAGTAAAEVGLMLGVEVPGSIGVRRTLRMTFDCSHAQPVPCLIDRASEAPSYSLATASGYSVGMVGRALEPDAGEVDEARFRRHSAAACRRYVRERLVGVGPKALAEVACEVPVSPLLEGGEGWRIIGGGDVQVVVAANAYKFAPLIAAELLTAAAG